MAKQLPPLRWAVRGIVPEGLTLFAGKRKMGKSWLALGLALAVTSGRPALGAVSVEPGPVLYLALEDHERRLPDRLTLSLAGQSAPTDLELATACSRPDRGGLKDIERWLHMRPTARLVIVDTFTRVRAPSRAGSNVYQEDYQAIGGLKALAERFHVAVLVVHHKRKGVALDPVDEISGSTGLPGGADTLMVLERQRGTDKAIVYLSGRDVEERELALTFDGARGAWHLSVNTRATTHLSSERRAVLEALEALDPAPGTPPTDRPDGGETPYCNASAHSPLGTRRSDIPAQAWYVRDTPVWTPRGCVSVADGST